MANKLTPQQKEFLTAYVANGKRNATKAYMDVYGCSKDSADSGASRVLGYASSQAFLAKLGEEAKEKSSKIIDIARRMEILSDIAENGRDNEKIRAIDVLNQMDSVYVQKQEITGAMPVVIRDDVPKDD
jgi:phage terminase small subunit